MRAATAATAVRHTRRVDDVLVPPCPGAPRGIRVPAAELEERFSRSSGPGGQGVNTADSRVQLSLDLTTTSALDEAQRRRVVARLAARLAGGVLTITAAEHRSQLDNRAAARRRLVELLRDAVAPREERRPTRATRGSQRKRLAGKRERAETKRNRRPPDRE